MTVRPLCFVLMPFGSKRDGRGGVVKFDAIYRDVIRPAIEDSGLEPLRADEEMSGGIIHKPMFERLILCEYAVADLTTANANVFYELGIRHAVRPWSTVLTFASGDRLPFDVALLRGLPYALRPDGTAEDPVRTREELAKRLQEARRAAKEAPSGSVDSPLFQLLESFPDVSRLKTDVFRERVAYALDRKRELAVAREEGLEAVQRVDQSLGDLASVDSAVVVDLLLSYRALEAWKQMIALVERMPAALAATVMVREQLAFALNRAGEWKDAEKVLLKLIEVRGGSSETYGILGRVYKDRWEAAKQKGEDTPAAAYLRKAVDSYLKGFESDWRDAYPGINTVTLMELAEPPDPRREDLLPVVTYAVRRRLAGGQPDYWDHATLLELAVLRRDEVAAEAALSEALISIREKWEPKSTLKNLRFIHHAREDRGEADPWLPTILRELERASP